MPSLSNIKPTIKITEKQFKALLERVLSKEGGIKPSAIEPQAEAIPRQPVNFGSISGPVQPAPYIQAGTSAIDELESAVEPMQRTMGRLYTEREGVRTPQDYPWAEARIRALQNSNYIPENSPRIPETLRLRTVAPGAPADLSEGGFAKGLAYERLKWRPIENKTEQVNRAVVSQAMDEAGVQATPEQKADISLVLGELWKQIGGPRSEARTYWEALRRTSRLKESVPDSRTYFIKSATHWKENPEGFKRQYPREAARLEDVWKKYMNGVVE